MILPALDKGSIFKGLETLIFWGSILLKDYFSPVARRKLWYLGWSMSPKYSPKLFAGNHFRYFVMTDIPLWLSRNPVFPTFSYLFLWGWEGIFHGGKRRRCRIMSGDGEEDLNTSILSNLPWNPRWKNILETYIWCLLTTYKEDAAQLLFQGEFFRIWNPIKCLFFCHSQGSSIFFLWLDQHNFYIGSRWWFLYPPMGNLKMLTFSF